MNRYLAAQTALECEALRAFARLLAELTDDSPPADLVWEIHAWLVDALSQQERAEVTSAMLTRSAA